MNITIKNIWGLTNNDSKGRPITKDSQEVGKITFVDESLIYAEIADEVVEKMLSDNEIPSMEISVVPLQGVKLCAQIQ